MNNSNFTHSVFVFCAALVMTGCSSSKDTSVANFVARMQVTEPIPGVCDNSNVIVVLPLSGNGQTEAVPPKTFEEVTVELNEQVTFLKTQPDFKGEGVVQLIINCQGDLVRCQIDKKTKHPEIDEQVIAVFSNLKKWYPGTLNKRTIDTLQLVGFEIADGKFTLN